MPRISRIAITALALAGAGSSSRADMLTIGPVNIQGNSFGDNGILVTPPDTDGSVGNNHYVQFTNGAFTIYNKNDGSLAAGKISDSQFWKNAGISAATISSGLSDTRVIFDPSSQRWFATEITVQNPNNSILVAVSNNADPTQGFKAVAITKAPPNNQFADFPTLSVNNDSVVIGTNNFNAAGTAYRGSQVFNIPKADLLGTTPSVANLTKSADLNGRGVTFQGVNDFSGTANHALFVGADNPGPSSTIHLTKLINPTGPGATLSAVTNIGVATYQVAGAASQPSAANTLDTGDARFSSAVYDVAGKIYSAHSILATNGSGLAAIQWFVQNDQTGALISQGVYQSTTLDYFYPSITANAAGNVVIGFTESGAGTFTSTAATLGTTDASGNVTFQSTLVTHAGTTTYNGANNFGETAPYRWGDYSATTADPTDSNVFWTTQEYANGAGSWATQVTELTVVPSIVPEPSSLALVTLGLVGLGLLASRRARTVCA